MNNFLYGYLIGALSLIPGISGGTVLFLTEYFDKFTYALANIFNKQIRKENTKLLITFTLGLIIGALTCAKVVELLFTYLPNESLLLIATLVLFSIPNIYKERLSNHKISVFYFMIGVIIIALLSSTFINLDNVVITNYPKISIIFLIWFATCGAIDGFLTILPGVSGSMTMMIIGPYFLYKSYLANLSFDTLIFLLPLIFYFIGDMLGIVLGSKTSCYLLQKHYAKTMSLIMGMVLASALTILPLNIINSPGGVLKTILIILVSFLLTNIKAIKKAI